MNLKVNILNDTKLAMPGGGLYALVAYGAQNVLLSGNPDFTYFYKSYKKYTHFAEESVTQSMDGPQDLSYDQPIQVRLKIQRVADLVRDMYFLFDLPDIYTKFLELPLQLSYGQRTSQYNFAWATHIGCHIIQEIGFYIGGQKIQEFDGAYMIVKAQADLDSRAFTKWSRLIGNIPDLFDPANGLYAGGSQGVEYPLVYNNNGPMSSTNLPNINRPSISGRTLQIPLPFWFTESTYHSLPLVSLQYQECEVQITLRPINQLYRILDMNGKQVAPGYQFNPSPISLQPENVYYTSVSDISDVTINNFLTDINTPKPLINTWPLNPRIQMTYVYLTDEERAQFSNQALQYLVRQVTTYQFPGISSREFVELQTHNPIERLLIVPRRSDSLQYRNQSANFSNWINPLRPPFIPSGYAPANNAINLISATGQFVLNGQRSILRSLAVLGDGNLLQEEKPLEYFTQVVPWKYLKGIPDPELLVYPFALHSPTIQPDGTVNSSRIRLFQVDLNVNQLPANSFYQYDITIFVENLNWVSVAGGTGGLKYAL